MMHILSKLPFHDSVSGDFQGATGAETTELGEFGPFNHLDFHRLLRSIRHLPEKAGAYAVFVRNGDRILSELGYQPQNKSRLVSPVTCHDHMYTGTAGNLRLRVVCHVKGDARTSTFRRSLLAAEYSCGALSRAGQPLLATANEETSLDLWLAMNAHLVWWCHDDHRKIEDVMLASLRSPLNLSGRKHDPFSRRLMEMRKAFQARDSHDSV
jgi:hypothetical protein